MLDRLKGVLATRHGPKILIGALVVLLGVPTGVVVRAATGGNNADDNAAVAVNTNDDSEVIRLAFRVSRTSADTVDPQNAAVAYASCENCRTIAIAIQAVIVLSDPSVVSPTNLAIAINENCTLCMTYADARQHVIGVDGPANFSHEGKRRIKEIRSRLFGLRKLERQGDLTPEELDAYVDALSAELAQVIQDEFVLASAQAQASASPSPTPSPAGTGVPDPAGSPSSTTPPDDTSQSPEPSPSSSVSEPSPVPSARNR
jgi:putative peptide zinc metalloprotease protein